MTIQAQICPPNPALLSALLLHQQTNKRLRAKGSREKDSRIYSQFTFRLLFMKDTSRWWVMG